MSRRCAPTVLPCLPSCSPVTRFRGKRSPFMLTVHPDPNWFGPCSGVTPDSLVQRTRMRVSPTGGVAHLPQKPEQLCNCRQKYPAIYRIPYPLSWNQGNFIFFLEIFADSPHASHTGHCRPVWSMVYSPFRMISEMGTKV